MNLASTTPIALCAAAMMMTACREPAGDDAVGSAQEPLTAIDQGRVLPSDTDGTTTGDLTTQVLQCLANPGEEIGCPTWYDDALGDLGNNDWHYFFRPSSSTDSSMLLVLLGGGGGSAPNPDDTSFYAVAATQGYHVLGLTYPAGKTNICGVLKVSENRQLKCFGDMLTTTITGVCSATGAHKDGCDQTNIEQHPQDSIESRLRSALTWARANKSGNWGRYLTRDGDPDWTRIRLAGHSSGASHAALMGLLHQDISRVVLLVSPDDGVGTNRTDWQTASYLMADGGERYFGLVHELNHGNIHPLPLYKTTLAWQALGMGDALDLSLFEPPGFPSSITGHMVVSIDPWTSKCEAHDSILTDHYVYELVDGCEAHCQPDPSLRWDTPGCDPNYPPTGTTIGYESAWRYVLGNGDSP
jgi:hypothetical protein